MSFCLIYWWYVVLLISFPVQTLKICLVSYWYYQIRPPFLSDNMSFCSMPLWNMSYYICFMVGLTGWEINKYTLIDIHNICLDSHFSFFAPKLLSFSCKDYSLGIFLCRHFGFSLLEKKNLQINAGIGMSMCTVCRFHFHVSLDIYLVRC